MFDTDISGGILIAFGIIIIISSEYMVFSFLNASIGWSIGLICFAIAFFKIMSLLDSPDDEADLEDEQLFPYE